MNPVYKFPEAVSNTIREAFVQCPHKAYWAYFRQQVPQTPSIHLHAGGSFAKGVEITRRSYYEEGLPAEHSIALGYEAMRVAYDDFDIKHGYTDHNKSFENLARGFMDYFMEYNLDNDPMRPLMTVGGKAALEFSFTIPTEVLNPDTGEPILYAGKFDMLGVRDEQVWVVDEKTTSQLGASWAKQWDLNSQFTGYCKAARDYDYPVVGAIIRGVGLLKTKISHQQVILSRADWQIDRWWAQLQRDLKMMVAMYEADNGDGEAFSYALGSACTSYGECAYKRLCESRTPEEWVITYYKKGDYNPLKTAVEE